MEMEEETIAASFGIFTNGTFRTFTQSMYHNQDKEVFIKPQNPNIVIVENVGRTWDYFFKTLPFLLNKDCLTTGTGQSYCTDEVHALKFYLNGIEDPDALDKPINNKDKLLINYGQGNLTEQLNKIPTIE